MDPEGCVFREEEVQELGGLYVVWLICVHIKGIRNDSRGNLEKYEPGTNTFSKLGSHWGAGRLVATKNIQEW